MHCYSIILRYNFDEFYDKYIGPKLHQQVEFIIAVAYMEASHLDTFITPFPHQISDFCPSPDKMKELMAIDYFKVKPDGYPTDV